VNLSKPLKIKELSIVGFFIILLISEWIGNYIWLPVGVRHVILLMIPLYLIISSGKIYINITIKASFFLILIVFFYFLQSIYTNTLSISSLFGWVFTYFFFFIYILISFFTKSYIDINFIIKNIVYILVLFSIYPFINSIFTLTSMRESYGVFRDSSAMASMMCIGVVLSNYLYTKFNSSKWRSLMFYFFAIVFFTTMKKSIIFLIVFWIFNIFPNSNKLTKIIGLCIFILIFAATSTIIIANINDVLIYENNVNPEDHVRWGMYIGAYNLADKYFPLGAGFSTFGSLFSIYDLKSGKYVLSETYYNLGLNNLADNEARLLDGRTTFLDTYYPHILGEGGFLQIIILLILIYSIVSLLKVKCKKTSNDKLYNCFFWILIMIFSDGITIISPEMPVFIFFISVLPAIINTNFKNTD
jgi:hypothetical protein